MPRRVCHRCLFALVEPTCNMLNKIIIGLIYLFTVMRQTEERAISSEGHEKNSSSSTISEMSPLKVQIHSQNFTTSGNLKQECIKHGYFYCKISKDCSSFPKLKKGDKETKQLALDIGSNGVGNSMLSLIDKLSDDTFFGFSERLASAVGILKVIKFGLLFFSFAG
ncbi:uncharacterized protein LOC136029444 isoform X7 [Artemia franciscana]|uniref:uncharacterized protein LOC136029444 isoform X7 n=1 Tax=Artemia franciscana TaxID=6661 RepID=UPI0032DA30B1